MSYKNTRTYSRETIEAHEKEIINDEAKSGLLGYYEKYLNIPLNNYLAVAVGFLGLFFLFGGLGITFSQFSIFSKKYVILALSFIVFAGAGFLFFKAYMNQESRNNLITKEFTSGFLFISFLTFIGVSFYVFELFKEITEASTYRWIVFILALIGVGITLFRNSSIVMLLTIPLILAFSYDFSASFLSIIRNPINILTSGVAADWSFISILLFCSVFLHFWLNVDTLSKRQDSRAALLGWIAAILGYQYLTIMIPGNFLLFTSLYAVGLYIFGKMYFDNNNHWYERPLQTVSLLIAIGTLYSLSFKGGISGSLAMSGFWGYSFAGTGWFFWLWFVLLLAVGAALVFFYIKPMYIDGDEQFNPLIITLPFFIILLMILGLFEWVTFPRILVNIYALGMAVYLMVNGSQEKYPAMYLLGLIFLVVLMYSRFIDMDVHWIFKSLYFIIVGASFFGIAFTLKDRTDGHENP